MAIEEDVKIKESETGKESVGKKSTPAKRRQVKKTQAKSVGDASLDSVPEIPLTDESSPFDLDVALREDSFQERGDEALFSDDAPAPEKEGKEGKKVSKKGKKKKVKRDIRHGRAYIKASYNNTLVTITDAHGGVVGWSSAGQMGFKGPKKATPYAAGVVVKNVMQKVAEYNLKEVDVFLCGVGQGREAALRALNAQGMKISSIKDVTPIPHNGCRPSKLRRV